MAGAAGSNPWGAWTQTFGFNGPTASDTLYLPANDKDPMAPSARRMLLAIANAAPTVCGGGAFLYGGLHFEKGQADGAGLGLIEYDTHSGWQTGSLLEGSFGPIGAARIDYTGGGGTEYLLLAGSPVAGTFGSESSVGIYGGSPMLGGGIYVNITTNAGCRHK